MDFSVFAAFDHAIFEFFGGLQTEVMNVIAQIFTSFGDQIFIISMAVLGVFLWLFKKTRKAGMAMFWAIVVGTLITNVIMKPLFARARPYVTLADDPAYMAWYTFAGAFTESDKSFPSGHTTGAFEIAIALLLSLNKKYSWAFPVVAILTGCSRIYLMVHFPTDVIGGMLVGIVAGVCGYYIMRGIMYKWNASKYADYDLIESIKEKKKQKA